MNETDAVVATALDYFEGWYDADPARVERALHPQLAKRWADQVGGDNSLVLSREIMLEFARQGGGADDKPDDPIEVIVADIHRDIAAAVVRSAQYREYLHLLRTPDGWRIVDALWQFTAPEQGQQP